MEQRIEIRPSESKRLQLIHDAAMEAFARDGYAGASMSSIARAVGGSKTTLYSRYNSKKELFLDVIRGELDRFFVALSRFASPGLDVEAALKRHCIEFAKTAQSTPTKNLFRLVISECNRLPEIQRDYTARVKDHIALLSAAMEENVGKPTGVTVNWQAAAQLLFDLDMNYLYQQLQDDGASSPEQNSPDEHAKSVLSVLLPPLTSMLSTR